MILRNFAVLEGGDGSGTSTQLELLRSRFASRPLPPALFATSEPTPGPVGALIRRALKGELVLERETLARLFAADRGEHLYGKDGLVERCERGELVVSDRYTPSSLVYQGLECGEELPGLLNRAFPHPELLIYIDLDSTVAMERIEKRREREIYETLEFLTRAAKAYKALLPVYEKAGVRVVSVNGSLPVDEAAAEIWRAIEEMPILKGELSLR